MKTKMSDYFVPWLDGLKMYVSPHIELAWKNRSLHRMMSNENPLEPSQKVLKAIAEYSKLGNRYSDQGLTVRTKIAEINGLDGPENVMLGNGSSEVYDMIWRSLVQPGEEIIQHTPCFGIYKLRCAVIGGKLISVPMIYKNGELLFDADSILRAVTPETKIIVIANPNNPTGNFMDDKDFVRIAETGIPFVIDEAYVEFAGLKKSKIGMIKDYPNVMITRTLSKAYGLAGLRFGYLLSNKDVVSKISAVLIPWNVSTLTMGAAIAAFEDTEGLKIRVNFINSQIEFIEKSLGEIDGLTIFHSHGNYVLFDAKGTGKKGNDIVAHAQKNGVILRPQPGMYGSDGFFRITVGTEEENKMAVKIIKDFITG
ncbi:MAG: aminotransferase class I/II-fold pyridoxal phosphate-dependent enzyme [Spirochaetes bacterium]|nr:aminotransferase class I/II-fold pyridoxal phosphate-dependent enzyme [Spirochaetota bacterium]